MFDHTSRYYHLKNLVYEDPVKGPVLYKRRRFIPLSDTPAHQLVTVQPAERLDLIAARTMGDPLQAWRIADANDAMDPMDLTSEIARTLEIPSIHF